jgi:hypothetical protein
LMPAAKASCMGMGERRVDTHNFRSSSLVDFTRLHSIFGLSEVFEDCVTAGLVIFVLLLVDSSGICACLRRMKSPPSHHRLCLLGWLFPLPVVRSFRASTCLLQPDCH